MEQSEKSFAQVSWRRWWPLLIVVALALLLLFLAGMNRLRQGNGRVIATINGQDILLDQYQTELRLKELKYDLAGRSIDEINEAELLNRMIGDVLLLQAASGANVTADEARVQSEIDGILARNALSRAEMSDLLAKHDLDWSAFEGSVRDYVTLSRFTDDVLLAEVGVSGRQATLKAWMSEQYQTADLSFDQEFLDAINGSKEN